MQTGFTLQPEGLWHQRTEMLLEWPTASVQVFLHQLRQTMRVDMLRQAKAPLCRRLGVVLDKARCEAVRDLTRTQKNFLCAMQLDSHRAKMEAVCPCCGGEGGVIHAVWECESTTVKLAAQVPPGANDWPWNFRRFALVMEDDELSTHEVWLGQHYITKVLIERRALQRSLDADEARHKAQKRRAEQAYTINSDSGEDLEGLHPELQEPALHRGDVEAGSHDADEATHFAPGQAASSSAMMMEPTHELFVPGRAASSTAVQAEASVPHFTTSHTAQKRSAAESFMIGSDSDVEHFGVPTELRAHGYEECDEDAMFRGEDEVMHFASDQVATSNETTMTYDVDGHFARDRATSPTAVRAETDSQQPVVDLTCQRHWQKRMKWDVANLPAHLVLTSDEFRKSYQCKSCGCFSAMENRSGFFRKHWGCDGSVLNTTRNRHFIRKSVILANQGLVPPPSEVLNSNWYQLHGILPRTLSQPVQGGLIVCDVCRSSAKQNNRKRFIAAHLECLRCVLTWDAEGNYGVNEDLLASCTSHGPSTFVIGDRTYTRRGRKPLRG
eukprot:4371781-Amphidinium_carterae.1